MVEVILSAIRPVQLLAGKVLGIGLLGIGCRSPLIAGVGVGGGAPRSARSTCPQSTAEAVVLVIVYFLLGYLLYACAFAVSGAIVSRQEDVQSSSAPLSILLVAGYLVSIYGDRHARLDRSPSCSTFVPPLAPMVVPARAAQDALPLSELLLSIALMVAATAAPAVDGGADLRPRRSCGWARR